MDKSPILKKPNDVKPSDKASLFHKVGEDSFFINSVCIYTSNQILIKNMIYELVDLTDDGGMKFIKFKFLNAILKGFNFYIIGIQVETGVVIHRTHRLDFGAKPCQWFIIDNDYFLEDLRANKINSYCNGNS